MDCTPPHGGGTIWLRFTSGSRGADDAYVSANVIGLVRQVAREQFYIVRFRQKDLWEDYPFDNDTLQTEFPDRWLEPSD
ncbi:MAG: nitrile hydratase subunit beta [Alphaproteobacteria bacterium]|nr:nitrile hydratase subunit beta [Alphaproteobacteria bacterium]